MIISFCIPNHNRTHDLKQTMPYLIQAANASPPVEIFVLDYNSPDDLQDYMTSIKETVKLEEGNEIHCRKYHGRDYFHNSHAFNLAVLGSKGEYCIILGTDAIPSKNYVNIVRERISDGCLWMRSDRLLGILTIKKEEFIACGGYDERIELYGGNDRDLDARLIRRELKFGFIPREAMRIIPTPNEIKVRDYRIKGNKGQLSRMMRPYVEENERNKVLTVNDGVNWGSWDA